MQCKNHPEAVAVDRCIGCAEPFCGDCLVDLLGQKYCGSCKTMALRGGGPIIDEATVPCKEANEALTYAIIGVIFSLVCIGIILELLALSKALQAKKLIAQNPRLSGSGKANAALIISSVILAIAILGIIAQAIKSGR